MIIISYPWCCTEIFREQKLKLIVIEMQMNYYTSLLGTYFFPVEIIIGIGTRRAPNSNSIHCNKMATTDFQAEEIPIVQYNISSNSL